MRKLKPYFLNLILGLTCLTLMSYTDAELEPETRSRFWGWSNTSCVPDSNILLQLNCKQCYYVLWIAVDCRECINFVGASNNADCKDY